MGELPSMPRGEELASHGRFLRALARSLVAPADQEDLVQETWTRALASPPRADAGLRAWLARILRHTARARGLRESERPAREETAFHARPAGASDDPGEIAAELELSRRVLESVERLREPYRSTLYLRYYRGLAPEGIAQETGTPVKTVKTRLARGLEELRLELDRLHGGDRRAWVALLLPLARPESAPVTPPSAAPVASGGLVLAGALTLAGAAALTLVLLDEDEAPRGQPVPVGPLAPPVTAEADAPAATTAQRERVPAAAPVPPPARDERIRLRGRALDLDGAALAGVEVAVTRLARSMGPRWRPEFESSELLARTTSARDGRFELVLDEPGAVRIALERDGHAPLAQRLLVFAGQELDLGAEVLEPGAALAGRVRDESGRALGGVELWQPLRDLGLAHGPSETWVLAGVSADDGSFELARVPAGNWQLEARAPLYRGALLAGAASAGQRQDGLEFVLAAGERVAGRVLGLEAGPLALVRVLAFEAGGAGAGPSVRAVRPESDGRFELGGFAAESEIELVLAGAELRRAEGATRVRAGTRDVVLQAGPSPRASSSVSPASTLPNGGGTLVVRVRAADGSGAAGALVRAAPLARPREAEVRAADSEGEALFEGLEPGSHALSVVAGVFEPDFASAAGAPVVSVASGETTHAELPALMLGRLEGVARVQGSALAGAEVRVRPIGDDDARRGPSPSLCARSGADGAFHFEGLPAGDYALVLSHAATLFPVEQTVVLAAGQNRLTLELELQTLEGRVLDADGRPLADVRVLAREEEERDGPRATRVPLARTDASGAFRIEGLELAALPALEFEAEGQALRVVSRPTSPLLVQLEREVPVRLIPVGPRAAFRRLLARGPQGERLHFFLRASDAEPIELHGLGPGRWKLSFDEGPGRPGRGAGRAEAPLLRELQLVAGEAFEFRIELE